MCQFVRKGHDVILVVGKENLLKKDIGEKIDVVWPDAPAPKILFTTTAAELSTLEDKSRLAYVR